MNTQKINAAYPSLAGPLHKAFQRNRSQIWLSTVIISHSTRLCLSRLTQTISGIYCLQGADGNAIGGLAVGEPTEKMYEMIEVVNEILPKDKPRYLMGVGTPVNILEGIERGVDMFDCVMPTRNGRNGMLFTKNGIMNMRNKKWEDDYSPIEAEGASYVDTMYSRAYLRHLFHAQELLAMQIASIHNLAFYLWLAGEARKHIIAGDFSTWKPMMVKRLSTRL